MHDSDEEEGREPAIKTSNEIMNSKSWTPNDLHSFHHMVMNDPEKHKKAAKNSSETGNFFFQVTGTGKKNTKPPKKYKSILPLITRLDG